MSTITIEVPQSKEKHKILNGIRQGLKEVKLMEEGKMKKVTYDEFMEELRNEKRSESEFTEFKN